MDSQYYNGDEINLVVGIDGLPLTKSSSRCFWLILGYVCPPFYKPCFFIGLYCGKDKPLDYNQFMYYFVNELQELHQEGIHTTLGKNV